MSRQAKELKAITGTANWRSTPATTLATAAAHIAATNNPHGVTAAQVGLGNVNNTSDANKPVSTAQAAAIAAHAPAINAVVDYGADNTGATDSSTAITNAVNAGITAGRPIYLPPGTYKCNVSVTGMKAFELFGGPFENADRFGSGVLTTAGAVPNLGAATILRPWNTASPVLTLGLFGGNIHDLAIIGTGAYNASTVGVWAWGTGTTVERVLVSDFEVGWLNSNQSRGTYRQCQFSACKFGYQAIGYSGGSQIGGSAGDTTSFVNCLFGGYRLSNATTRQDSTNADNFGIYVTDGAKAISLIGCEAGFCGVPIFCRSGKMVISGGNSEGARVAAIMLKNPYQVTINSHCSQNVAKFVYAIPNGSGPGVQSSLSIQACNAAGDVWLDQNHNISLGGSPDIVVKTCSSSGADTHNSFSQDATIIDLSLFSSITALGTSTIAGECFFLKLDSNQSIASNGDPVKFTSVDTWSPYYAGGYDSSTGIWTCPRSGWYEFSGAFQVGSSIPWIYFELVTSAGQHRVINPNRATVAGEEFTFHRVAYVALNQQVQLKCYRASTLNIEAGSSGSGYKVTGMSIRRVR